jgi:hypothetical protein
VELPDERADVAPRLALADGCLPASLARPADGAVATVGTGPPEPRERKRRRAEGWGDPGIAHGSHSGTIGPVANRLKECLGNDAVGIG